MKKMNDLQHSPLPRSKPYPLRGKRPMNFYAALRAIAKGRKATKLEWDNPNIYIYMNKEHLQIVLADGLSHDLIVSEADMIGTDWVIL